MRRDGFEPVIGTGGRSQKHRRQSHAIHFSQVLGGFFDNHVDDQHAIGAGCGRVIGKARQPVAQNGIEISKDDQARVRPRGANVARDGEHIGQRVPRGLRLVPWLAESRGRRPADR